MFFVVYLQTTRKVLRSDDQTATATVTAVNVASNQSPTHDSPTEQKSVESNGSDENKEPPAKRLRTRAAVAASNHQ